MSKREKIIYGILATVIVVTVIVGAFISILATRPVTAGNKTNSPVRISSGSTTVPEASSTNRSAATENEPVVVTVNNPQKIQVSLIVHGTSAVGTSTYLISMAPGASAYDAMVALASTTAGKADPFSFDATYYSGLGYFIMAIDGQKNAGGLYWTLYVNGTYSPVGASDHVLSQNDRIEWRYQ
jgi:hypothetical protein